MKQSGHATGAQAPGRPLKVFIVEDSVNMQIALQDLVCVSRRAGAR